MSKNATGSWARLAQRLGVNFSLSPEWSAVTAASHGITNSTEIIFASIDNELEAVFPILVEPVRDHGIPLRSLELVGNKVSYHNNLISNLAPTIAVALLLGEARRNRADLIHLAAIPDDSDLARFLKSDGLRSECSVTNFSGETSPYLPLTKAWDDLLATKPKKFRYKLRKRAELLDSSLGVEMRWFTEPQECELVLEAIREIEENSWKKNAGISIFDKEHESRYYQLLLPLLAQKKAVFANILYSEKVPIAYNLCCVRGGWVGQLKTSFDTRYAHLSPGSLVIDFAIRHAIDLGADEFDFLGSADPHKMAWTSSVRAHSDFFLYLRSSVKGNLVGRLKELRRKFAK